MSNEDLGKLGLSQKEIDSLNKAWEKQIVLPGAATKPDHKKNAQNFIKTLDGTLKSHLPKSANIIDYFKNKISPELVMPSKSRKPIEQMYDSLSNKYQKKLEEQRLTEAKQAKDQKLKRDKQEQKDAAAIAWGEELDLGKGKLPGRTDVVKNLAKEVGKQLEDSSKTRKIRSAKKQVTSELISKAEAKKAKDQKLQQDLQEQKDAAAIALGEEIDRKKVKLPRQTDFIKDLAKDLAPKLEAARNSKKNKEEKAATKIQATYRGSKGREEASEERVRREIKEVVNQLFALTGTKGVDSPTKEQKALKEAMGPKFSEFSHKVTSISDYYNETTKIPEQVKHLRNSLDDIKQFADREAKETKKSVFTHLGNYAKHSSMAVFSWARGKDGSSHKEKAQESYHYLRNAKSLDKELQTLNKKTASWKEKISTDRAKPAAKGLSQ